MKRGLVLVALLVPWGCKRHAPAAPALDAIEVRTHLIGPPGLQVPPDAELEKLAAEAVSAVPGPMRYKPRADPSTKLAIAIDLGWEPGLLHASVRAQLASRGEDAGVAAVERQAVVEKEHVEAMPSLDQVRDHVRRALQLTAAPALAAEELWLGPPDQVRAALRGTDDDLRMDAIGFVSERRDRDAVPMLIEILKNPDESTRDRAIGALAEIGDSRAVHPLAELAKFSEWDQLPKIIDALGKIGGTEATDYLEFVASGHQSPVIRDMAKSALAHMRATTVRGQSPAP